MYLNFFFYNELLKKNDKTTKSCQSPQTPRMVTGLRLRSKFLSTPRPFVKVVAYLLMPNPNLTQKVP